jgi:uncharacterized membrane protein
LLTIFVISLTVLSLVSEVTSNRAIWSWAAVVVVAVTGLLLAAREVRRRRGARRPS